MSSELKSRFIDCISNKQGKDLDLSALSLPQCPTQVTENVKLRDILRLNLGFNKISVFPDFRNLKSLSILHFGGNQLRSLEGPSFASLVRLKELTLNGNSLVSLPSSVGDFTGLQKLDLANNNLRILPNEIGYLEKLEDLNLSGNGNLTELPRTLRELGSLEVLNADFCSISSLPSEVTYCSRLLELSLAGNRLIALPSDVGRMTRLVRLNLVDNRLTDLPISMGMCESLGQFGAGAMIGGNPIRNEEIWKANKIGPDHLLFYLQKKMDVVYNGSPPALPEVPDHNLLRKRVKSDASGPVMTSIDLSSLTGGANRSQARNVAATAQATTQKAREERKAAREMVEALRKWGNEQCNMFIGKLRKIERALDSLRTMEQAQSLMRFAKKLEPHVNNVTHLIPYQEPAKVPTAPAAGASQIDLARHKIQLGCAAARQVIEGCAIVLDTSSSQETIVDLCKALKPLSTLM